MANKKLLVTALRQYCSNDGSGEFKAGYDYEETNKIVSGILNIDEIFAGMPLSHTLTIITSHGLVQITIDSLDQYGLHLTSNGIDVSDAFRGCLPNLLFFIKEDTKYETDLKKIYNIIVSNLL